MSGKTVLVVDDSPTVRQLVSLALKQAGFGVVEAVDGQDGVTRLKADASISLVISDINMPKLNGIDMLAEIRKSAVNPNVPVVMLTTEGHASLLARAKELGAKGWLMKPFNAAQLVSVAQKLTA